MHEQILRWLHKFGHPAQHAAASEPLDEFDTRISENERKLRSIEIRLRLLERQADPRGWQQHG